MPAEQNPNGDGEWVYTPYITRNGKRIYRGSGKVFKFFVPATKAK